MHHRLDPVQVVQSFFAAWRTGIEITHRFCSVYGKFLVDSGNSTISPEMKH